MRNLTRIAFVIAVAVLAAVAFAVVSSGDEAPPRVVSADDAALLLGGSTPMPLFEPVGKGGGKTACCDPAAEPGVGGNPFCFEGHTCCADGQWRCNNPDGSPSCDPGQVCDAGCGGRNAACSTGTDCCSGVCRKGRCR